MKFECQGAEFDGAEGAITVSSFEAGAPDMRTNDNDQPQRDGLRV